MGVGVNKIVMKKLIIICLLGLTSCDPPRIDPFTLNYVILKAEIASDKSLNLGDTLKIHISIPDSLEYIYYKEGLELRKKIFVNSIQEIGFAVDVYKFDTINGGLASYKDDNLNFSLNHFQVSRGFGKSMFNK